MACPRSHSCAGPWAGPQALWLRDTRRTSAPPPPGSRFSEQGEVLGSSDPSPPSQKGPRSSADTPASSVEDPVLHPLSKSKPLPVADGPSASAFPGSDREETGLEAQGV